VNRTEQQAVTFPQVKAASGAWQVSVEVDGSSVEGAIGEASQIKEATMTAAEQACRILNVS